MDYQKEKSGQVDSGQAYRELLEDIEEESLDWQGLDVEKTVQVGFSSHLYLYGYDNEDVKPPSLLQGYRVPHFHLHSLYSANL